MSFGPLELISWGGPAALVVGLLCAFLIYLRGSAVLERPARAVPEEASETAKPNVKLDPFVFGSRVEKRGVLRRRGSQIAVFVSEGSGTGQQRDGWVVDRSASGLGLLLEDAPAVGTFLNVRAANAAALMPCVQVQVRYCRKQAAGWVVGCQFVKTPPTTVLWQFG